MTLTPRDEALVRARIHLARVAGDDEELQELARQTLTILALLDPADLPTYVDDMLATLEEETT